MTMWQRGCRLLCLERTTALRNLSRHRAILTAAVLITCGGLLSACDLAHDLHTVDPAIVPYNLDVYSAAEAPPPIDLDTFYFREDRPKDPTETPTKPTAYERAVVAELHAVQAPNDSAKREEANLYRNRLQDEIQIVSDIICARHQTMIVADSVLVNFSAGFVQTTLSGISAVLGGETAKTVLSTGASIVGTGQALFNEEFLQNLLSTALIRQIRAEREKEMNEIIAKRNDEASSYSVDEAIRDIGVRTAEQ